MGCWGALFLIAAPLVFAGDEDCRALVKAGAEAKARDCYFATAQTAATPTSQADALFQGGRSQTALGDYKGAVETYTKVLELRRQAADRKGEGVALNDLGSAHWSLGDFPQGLRYFRDALAVRETLHDTYGAALTRTGMGHIYAAWGETETALAYYTDALKAFRELKNERFQAETLNAIGLTYAGIGEHSKATTFYMDALALWRKLGLRSREGYTLNNLGLLELDRHAPRAAEDFFDRALPMMEESRDLRAQAYVRNNQGEAEAALHHLDRALELKVSALELERKIGDQAGEAFTLQCMGDVLAASGDLEHALERFNEALALQHKAGSRPDEAVALGGRARVLRSLGRLDEARASIEGSLQITEGLRARLSNRDLRTTFFSTQQDYYAFYIDLLMSMHADTAALNANERSRARVLLDMLREAKVDPREGVPAELVERKQTIERDLRALAQRPGAKLEESLRQWDEVDAAIRKSNPRYAALVSPEPISVEDIQRTVLDPNTVLIEYALGGDRSFAWLLTPTAVRSAILPGRARIEALVRKAVTSLDARNQSPTGEELEARRKRIATADAAFETAARELGRVLLGPFARDLNGKRLLIVPDGALHYVPFAALRLPGAQRPLLATNEVVRAPSASIVGALRTQEHAAKPRGTVIAIADPVFDSADPRVLGDAGVATGSGEEFEYTRLRFSRQEADSIAAFTPTRSRTLTDFEANREAVLASRLGDYRIVHFATHAEIDNEHPGLSRIVVSRVDRRGRSRDGAIRLFEIFNLKLNADLVVLSACRSALGKDIRGEGLVGLTRGFFYAGAKGVVASLWDVEDRATAELMKRFYEPMLRHDEAPASALRHAQLVLAADPRWASPYYWASFTLQGDWQVRQPMPVHPRQLR